MSSTAVSERSMKLDDLDGNADIPIAEEEIVTIKDMCKMAKSTIKDKR